MVADDYPRSLPTPKDSFFLFGIRGVGKSTWARQRFPQAPRIDLLDEGLFQAYLRDPSRFGQEIRRHKRGTWVIVDEVQRLPSLLNQSRALPLMSRQSPRLVTTASSWRAPRA
jgi:predicted AAA+ superfamily ATPase